MNKLSETENFTSSKTETVEQNSSFVSTSIDTSNLSNIEMTYMMVKFFDPGQNFDGNNHGSKTGQCLQKKESDPMGNVYKPPSRAIKSIETVTIRQTKEDKAESVTIVSNNDIKTKVDSIASRARSLNNESPAPDPYRWRYICYIIVLLIGIAMYLKRSKIFIWVASKIWKIKRFFSK